MFLIVTFDHVLVNMFALFSQVWPVVADVESINNRQILENPNTKTAKERMDVTGWFKRMQQHLGI